VAPRVAEAHGEPAHHHAGLAGGPRGELVLPREMVPRARRQHLDGAARRGEMLGEPADQGLGAAHDVGAVARHDEGQAGPAAGGCRDRLRGPRPAEEPSHGRRPITA
jgi:hypothetical protein